MVDAGRRRGLEIGGGAGPGAQAKGVALRRDDAPSSAERAVSMELAGTGSTDNISCKQCRHLLA